MVVKNNHIIKENKEDKALVKSTGEILDIKNTYMTYTVNVSFGEKYSDMIKNLLDSHQFDFDYNEEYSLSLNSDETGTDIVERAIESSSGIKVKYQLVNGNSYDESELIVGSQNIRNVRLNNILEDGVQ